MSGPIFHDDGKLLNDFRARRDEAAFTELVRRHLPLVFHVALRRLDSAALAEEAAQHTFARLAAKAAKVARHPERLRAWLHRTAYFEASTLARKEARLSRLPMPPRPDPEPMNRPEIYDRLDELLNRMPELDRELVLRHCCGGEDYRRMAAAVGKSEAACQKRVERALARLGQQLGGSRTAGLVAAAFAATSTKSQAIPAAERVAAAALKYHGATGGVAGAISGTQAAACAAIALAGGVAGWQPPDAVPETLPPATAHSASPRRTAAATALASTGDTPLAPRPLPVDRSLGEVLETINTGRLAPLVEFLPRATVAGLRSIIVEDDIYEYGEQDGKEHFSTARNLALLRWAEIDPPGAFQWATSSDRERWRGFSLGDSPAVLAKWLQADPGAAVTALGTLSLRDQIELTEWVFKIDPDTAEHLAAIAPRLAWVVDEQRILHPDAETLAAEAERLVAKILTAGPRDEPLWREAEQIRVAFHRLFEKDPAGTLAKAKRVPWPGLRDQVLAILENRLESAAASADLPPGKSRHETLVRETSELMVSDPEAAISRFVSAAPGPDRDALFQGMSAKLAGSDPWRLLEIVASQDPANPLPSFDLGRVLRFAGKTDPARAMRMLPGIASRVNHGGTRSLTEMVLSGWAANDVEAAIRWAANAGIRIDALHQSTEGPQALVHLLSDQHEGVRQMARNALISHVADADARGEAGDLLARMPRTEADAILSDLSFRAMTTEPPQPEEALRIAAMASPDARTREILPGLAVLRMRLDPEGAPLWINRLPAADRQAVITRIEEMLDGTSDHHEARIRRSLELINP